MWDRERQRWTEYVRRKIRKPRAKKLPEVSPAEFEQALDSREGEAASQLAIST
jgi:hypothetical protein